MIKGDHLIRKFEIALVLVTPDRRQMRRQKAVKQWNDFWFFFFSFFFFSLFFSLEFLQTRKKMTAAADINVKLPLEMCL